MVHDALLSGRRVKRVVMTNSKEARLKEIETLANKLEVPVAEARPEEVKKMAESSNPQGVIAFLELPEPVSLKEVLSDNRQAFILLLGQIDYEQNLGAILRSAWAAGVDMVIASTSGVHEVTPVVAKVSMGAAAYVPLLGMSLYQAIKTLKDMAVPIVGVEVGMGKPYFEQNLRGPVALLMGGEAAGLTEPLIKECDVMVNIPMKAEVASLNVSVATALVLYEKVRQEKQG